MVQKNGEKVGLPFYAFTRYKQINEYIVHPTSPSVEGERPFLSVPQIRNHKDRECNLRQAPKNIFP